LAFGDATIVVLMVVLAMVVGPERKDIKQEALGPVKSKADGRNG
jgi:hypothetical protein